MASGPALSGLLRDLLAVRQPESRAKPLTMPLPDEVAREAKPSGKPVKLWNLAPKHHCPVVGTCLRMDDLVRFARRYRFEADSRDEFELHVEAVSRCQSRNEVSEAIHKHLDRKYGEALQRFSRLKTEAAVVVAWKECLARGDVAGPLWATYTHRATSTATSDAVYADIHMLSHQVGAGQAADVRRLAFLEKENASLKQALDAESRQHQQQTEKLKRQVCELESSLHTRMQLDAEVSALRARLARAESRDAHADVMRELTALQRANEQMAAAFARAGEMQNALQAAQEQIAELTQQRDAEQAEREALEMMLTADRRAESVCGLQCECCEAGPTQRCILYVGGRTSLVAHYRELAERLGVRLVHHDGGQEEALSRLPELIHRADAVICPTDCVSHTAYYNLKNHCKRTGKPCLFFKGTGVGSFAIAMTRVAKGEFSLQAQDASA